MVVVVVVVGMLESLCACVCVECVSVNVGWRLLSSRIVSYQSLAARSSILVLRPPTHPLSFTLGLGLLMDKENGILCAR